MGNSGAARINKNPACDEEAESPRNGTNMILQQTTFHATSSAVSDWPASAVERQILDEASFRQTIARERSRTDRSGQPFLLMLVELNGDPETQLLDSVQTALSCFVRETDVVGWYEKDAVIGILFTEVSSQNESATAPSLVVRVMEILRRTLTPRQISGLAVSCHAYPESSQAGACSEDRAAALFPDLCHREQHKKLQHAIKRAIDIAGSSLAILILAPVFAVTALLVKLSSRGPVIYRQQRLGQFGKPFNFLKFRSMRVDSDHAIHREFMKAVISGNHSGETSAGGGPVYKMTADPRITPIGRFLRKFSLDELPQFINVLRGEMSLVGPRPPIKYEYEHYQLWHRRRILIARPGITGLWQVEGRSRVSFDDMVRLDLEYVRKWSLWLDLKILIKTPAAVLMGDGAY